MNDMGTQHKSKLHSDHPMDRRIRSSKPYKRWLLLALLILAGVVAFVLFYEQGKSLHMARDRLVTGTAQQGVFDDFIPLRARVEPRKTVFLDAIQGGRVDHLLVEDGADVRAGQTIARLSNSDLQLSVMSTESRVIEQLNVMREQELRLEQNRLNHKTQLASLSYHLERLTRQNTRFQALLTSGHISQETVDKTQDELRHYQRLYQLSLEAQASDERLMAKQLEFYQTKATVMEENLAFARESLEALHIRAPFDGRLSGFDLVEGQSIQRGDRIGQISQPRSFKLKAGVDEYYLGRIVVGQSARIELQGKPYELSVSKVYPDVRGGQFQVDMTFEQDMPDKLRLGQSVQSRLQLGASEPALLIPNGPYFQDTGGRWLYVLSQDGREAKRRQVRLGRRNNDFIEVISGLNAGEEIITSAYAAFKDADRLKLSQDS
ncbi:efflux RND transporter periplasmic adaptor subunit [Pseudoteredinibacter isoporae]|uniref:HlyD family secretion protein n=1 Tax=Pseudoteredinibacter isoporae TaxID=570281 RepID=A0A7X0MVL0_9GAMM|nr:efflux RND transporter periplasmic adaptor subunit [Pseudoteredinibacter isoporae]MBB6521508.1 HlyD family secretion protein [Pseudoteredinibacter isoporae]NHO87062.1 efflux RND transporter periplasmic adaptor subunit [Pseudoteredinibacter isoporae]NIB22809.1 efflux RND transporter periplasmic adaptor subunit [Pseudoteredinibacter isoporae]